MTVSLLVIVLLSVIYTDVYERKIYNLQNGMLFVLSMIYSFDVEMVSLMMTLIYAAILSIMLYFFRFWGGGDCKLFVAISLLFLPVQLVGFFIFTLLCGGIMSLVFLIKKAIYKNEKSPNGMPYAVSIISGALVQLLVQR